MKPVFLLLFTVSLAMGQTVEPENRLQPWSMTFSDSSNLQVFHGEDTLTQAINPYAAVALNQLLRFWREYKAECADTVKVENPFHSIRFTEDTTQVVGSLKRWRARYVNDSIYVPRNRYPSTEGFLDWLIKRTAKGQ